MASPNLPLMSLMYPTLIAGPFHREGWVYEEQYDGCRMVAYKDGTAVPECGRARHAVTVAACCGTHGALPPTRSFSSSCFCSR